MCILARFVNGVNDSVWQRMWRRNDISKRDVSQWPAYVSGAMTYVSVAIMANI